MCSVREGWGESERKYVALTFDDGPHWQNTPRLLDILQENGVRATFFIIGNRVDDHRAIVERMFAEGHMIGNHTWSHKNVAQLSEREARDELEKTNRKLMEVTGRAPFLFRPPMGEWKKGRVCDGMAIILWSVDPDDWHARGAGQIARSVIRNTGSGDIILLHDMLAHSVEAVEDIIKILKAEGFEFVTVDELITASYGYVDVDKIYSRVPIG